MKILLAICMPLMDNRIDLGYCMVVYTQGLLLAEEKEVRTHLASKQGRSPCKMLTPNFQPSVTASAKRGRVL